MSRAITAAFLAVVFSSQLAAAQVAVPGQPSPLGQPPRDTVTATTRTATIRGHVFDASTGRPMRKARVRASAPELLESVQATTDDNGAYELTDLPAGRYQLTAVKAGFTELPYGQTRAFQPGNSLQVRDGQTVDKIDFRLPRGAVITGRVVDEAGEATADIQVSTMRSVYLQGRRQFVPVGSRSVTNDIGEFRLFGLAPGQYIVSASFSSSLSSFVNGSPDRSGYAPTYYPGTSVAAEAQRITVDVGQTMSDLTIVLSPARLARISGTAFDSDGKPLANVNVMASPRGMTLAGTSGTGQIRPDGSFSINGVAPGDYVLRALSPDRTDDNIQANVTVAGEDVSGVRLKGVKLSNLTGHVVLSGANATPGSLQLMTTPIDAEPNMFATRGYFVFVEGDGAFEMHVPPGRHAIRLGPDAPGSAITPMAISAVRLNGADVTDTGIEVKPNEDIRGIEIELTTMLSDVSGLVTGARGESTKDFSVVVFARDSQKWTAPSRYLSVGRPDQDGRFHVRGLPASDYYAIALDVIDIGTIGDPEYFDRLKDRATAFSLNDGESRSLDLRLVANP